MTSVPNVSDNLRNAVQPDPRQSTRWAWVAGIAAFVITVFIYFGFQFVFHPVPMYQMLDAVASSSNSLCFAGMTSSATILPLMLTIFSFARKSDTEFDHWFYKRVRWIALLCSCSFVIGLLALTLLSAPISDMSAISTMTYRILYYAIVGSVSLLVSILAAEIILLYHCIVHILDVLDPLGAEEKQQEQSAEKSSSAAAAN